MGDRKEKGVYIVVWGGGRGYSPGTPVEREEEKEKAKAEEAGEIRATHPSLPDPPISKPTPLSLGFFLVLFGAFFESHMLSCA